MTGSLHQLMGSVSLCSQGFIHTFIFVHTHTHYIFMFVKGNLVAILPIQQRSGRVESGREEKSKEGTNSRVVQTRVEFSWQVQHLVMLDWGSCCPAHCNGCFTCERD